MLDDDKKEAVVDRWFTENEEKMLKKARERMQKEKAEREGKEKDEELKKLKEKHWMKCPKCEYDMEIISIEGIELDQCKHCKGTYFDTGELDELLMIHGDKRKSFSRKLIKPILK